MKIYIVFETQISEFDTNSDEIIKVFAKEEDAEKLIQDMFQLYNNPYYWYSTYHVE